MRAVVRASHDVSLCNRTLPRVTLRFIEVSYPVFACPLPQHFLGATVIAYADYYDDSHQSARLPIESESGLPSLLSASPTRAQSVTIVAIVRSATCSKQTVRASDVVITRTT